MSLTLDFRVVGIYAYFPNITFENLDENATIADITEAVKQSQTGFDYMARDMSNGKPKVLGFSYDLEQVPAGGIPSAKNPTPGDRMIAQTLNTDPASVWQYYRAAVLSNGTDEITVRNPTSDQPSFMKTTISEGLVVPDGFEIVRYRLIWRLLIIDMAPDDKQMFQNAARALIG